MDNSASHSTLFPTLPGKLTQSFFLLCGPDASLWLCVSVSYLQMDLHSSYHCNRYYWLIAAGNSIRK